MVMISGLCADVFGKLCLHGAHYQQRHHHAGTGLGSFIPGKATLGNTTACNDILVCFMAAVWGKTHTGVMVRCPPTLCLTLHSMNDSETNLQNKKIIFGCNIVLSMLFICFFEIHELPFTCYMNFTHWFMLRLNDYQQSF